MIQNNLSYIYYLKSYGNYVKFWLGKEYIFTPRTLSSFESQILETDFFRIHKSHIVNKKYIDYVE
ncbi:MAG: two-component system LytT family response regulator [Cognaticolwellia sp.]